MKISFIGAGNVASNLGALFSGIGHTVNYGTHNPTGNQLTVAEACKTGEMVCFAIPYSAMKAVLTANKDALKGKIVVDITNPLNADWSPIPLGEDSSGEQTFRLLPDSKVVKAFNTIFADVMKNGKQKINQNALVAFIASDDKDAANVVKQLSDEIGYDGLLVGGIKNARYLEAMAHLNISIALSGGGTDVGFAYLRRE